MDAFVSGGGGGSGARNAKGSARAPVIKPWVEKYRPKSTKDVAAQAEVVAVLQNCIRGGDMPHLLFYGPPGTGKTSTILAMAKELFGPVLVRDRVLELNASDERGISVVRDKIKGFASTTAGQVAKGYPCPPFKIIILDEADAMTSDAQSALRRTIENHSKVTRFCLICNYVSRIIEPLASRCAKFRFKPLAAASLEARLLHVRDSEGVITEEGVLPRLVTLSGGDMRQAITFLQSAHRFRGEKPVRVTDVEEVACAIPDEVVDNIYKRCRGGSFERLEVSVREFVAAGYPAARFLGDFLARVTADEASADAQKARVALHLGVVDKRLLDGADEFLQIMDLCGQTMKILGGGA